MKKLTYFQTELKVVEYLDRYYNSRIILSTNHDKESWNEEKKSLFIESILLGYPITPFYVNQQKDGKWLVIDSLQKSTSLIDFMRNRFKMEDLDYLSLPLELKAKLERAKIIIYVLKPSNSIEVIYDLFKRVNNEGTKLTLENITNAIF
jgi:uncharacterized protein with ParB-like and HNH nuclease domain